MWKAWEWCSWLLAYSLICLEGILPKKYLKHLSLLVSAVTTLFSESISPEELRKAHLMLVDFVVQFQDYYGKESMNYNIHLLLHLAEAVKNLGPLWANNAFCFENENRFILKLKKSPKLISKQIGKRYLFYKSLPIFANNLKLSANYFEFVEPFQRHLSNLLIN